MKKTPGEFGIFICKEKRRKPKRKVEIWAAAIGNQTVRKKR